MAQIVVSKFGGSSMKDHEAMLRSATISKQQGTSITIVSATYGTTDQLHLLIERATNGDWDGCEKLLFLIREKHIEILKNLTDDKSIHDSLRELTSNLETLARGIFLLSECSEKAKDRVVSFGERVSSLLFTEALKISWPEKNIILFDSRKLLRTNSQHGKAKPELNLINDLCKSYFEFSDKNTYVGQGYIGADEHGSTTTLGRGGSDYSAALFAEAVDATTLEIWTDVAGIATTDPRVCNKTKPIHEISYDEASEMAQYGAKILHPTTLVPAMRKKIPVFVGSSYAKDEKGTWIKEKIKNKPLIRAITKRQDQALLTIRTPKMLDAFGFMGRIFDIFTKYEVSVDCVTTSEISVAVTVSKETIENNVLLKELALIGEVISEPGYTLISLIGNEMLQKPGLARKVFSCINDVNVRMLCLGASAYNFNILVENKDGDNCIKNLHCEFIES